MAEIIEKEVSPDPRHEIGPENQFKRPKEQLQTPPKRSEF